MLFLEPQPFVFFQVVSFVPPSRTLLLFLTNSADAVEDHLSGLQNIGPIVFCGLFDYYRGFSSTRDGFSTAGTLDRHSA